MTKQERYHQRKPWVRYVTLANRRCRDPRHERFCMYGGKGIQCNLKADDAEFLWRRDKAHLLKKPSLDRIDPNGNYTRDNCRFIEYWLNVTSSNSYGRQDKRALTDGAER